MNNPRLAMFMRGCSTALVLFLFAVVNGGSSNSGSKNVGKAMSFADGLLSSIPAGFCLDYRSPGDYWSYRWCHRFNVTQYRGRSHHLKSQEQLLGLFNSGLTSVANSPSFDVTHGFDRGDACVPPGKLNPPLPRETKVNLMCCSARRDRAKSVHLKSVSEPFPCEYEVTVCVPSLCVTKPSASPVRYSGSSSSRGGSNDIEEDVNDSEEAEDGGEVTYPSSPQDHSNEDAVTRASRRRDERRRIQQSSSSSSSSSSETQRNDERSLIAARIGRIMSPREREAYKEAARRMFVQAYDGYMYHAYPKGELAPVTCSGRSFDMIRLPAVTLIDTLDTLVVMGNFTEFRRAVLLVKRALPSKFDFDDSVSVFETTIRILGGLLSAHQLATDPILNVYPKDGSRAYDGSLLDLALDLGQRLLPAFHTPTGIPYGTVNLRHGVPRGETPVASLAGAGSLALEFTMLSHLSGLPEYGMAAQQAAWALHSRRTPLGLLGKHVNVRSGKWSESVSGIGSNADSYFEYLLKMYLLFGDVKWWHAYLETVKSIDTHLRRGDWFIDVDTYSGQPRRQRFENLMAFWPGVQALAGDLSGATQSLNAFCLVWRDWGFLPEEYDFTTWQLSGTSLYPLRPELIESIYLVRRATGEDSWLWAGASFLESLAKHTGTSCGHATVKNVATLELEDTMPSFFLAETAKYLYLLFDDANWIHDRPFVFTTEAHPFLMTRSSSSSSPETNNEEDEEAAMAADLVAKEVVAEATEQKSTCEANADSGPIADNDTIELVVDGLAEGEASEEDKKWHARAKEVAEGMMKAKKAKDSSSSSKKASSSWPPPSLRVPPPKRASFPPVGAKTLQSKVPHWLAELGYDADYADDLGTETRRRAPPSSGRDGAPASSGSGRSAANRFKHAFNDLPWHLVSPRNQDDDDDADDDGEEEGSEGGRKGSKEQSTWADAPVAETGGTTFSMGDLGTFKVSVFTDGFLVENLDDGETLEIANIGSGVVSVVNSRPYNPITHEPAVSRAVASNLHSQTLVCRINLDHEGTAASANVNKIGNESEEDDHDTNAVAALIQSALSPLPLPALFNIPCAVSGFGRSLDADPTPPVSGTMHFSSTDPRGCADPPTNPSSSTSAPAPPAAPAAAAEPTGPHSWVFPRPSAPPPSSSAQQESGDESGMVAVVRRGDCMFEHKARVAERKGAAAVVVVNSQYGQNFIMSGQSITTPSLIPNPPQPSNDDGTPEEKEEDKSAKSDDAAAVDDAIPSPAPVGIPVVMVAREHGELLEAAQRRLAAKGFTPKLSVHVDKHPRPGSSSSDSNRYDDDEENAWPKVVVAANSLQVLGMGEWGAFLSSPSGKEWQLFVTRKQATSAANAAENESGGSSTVPVE